MFHTVGNEICNMTVQRTHFYAFMTTLPIFLTLLTVTYTSTICRACIVTYAWQQQLCEHATMLCYTYIAYLAFDSLLK